VAVPDLLPIVIEIAWQLGGGGSGYPKYPVHYAKPPKVCRRQRGRISAAFLALNDTFNEPNDEGGNKGLDALNSMRRMLWAS
jgi:hypothetical protein